MVRNRFRVLACFLLACCFSSTSAEASTLVRPADPVVLSGSAVAGLLGVDPGDLVAFRWNGSWEQIPVQVDERDIINFSDVYDNIGGFGGNIMRLDYTDDGTFTGPDSDTTLDADDEIVFMAKDAGGQSTASSEPPGTISGSGIEIRVTDPIAPGIGFVYLFEQSGSLDPAAGQQYVDYQFNLLSGDYKTTYGIASGPNPENTSITTASYVRHFSDRWITDELKIVAGASTGVDILDRHKNLFGPGVCSRSEDTFSNAEGAFVINKSGPVRAIRSYVGANSGPLTQRQHLFYESREDVTTFLRVHAIPGVMDFYDYSPAASGMTYRNDANLAGVTIDGLPDSVTPAATVWEQVTGVQGSLTHVAVVNTTVPLMGVTSYYVDDVTPSDTQCTGDAFAYGSSGAWFNQALPNTDPRSPPFDILEGTRTIYVDPPGLVAADAEQRADWVLNPLDATASPWSPSSAGIDHFKCYKAKDLGSPKFVKTTVSLADQFGVNDGSFEIKKPFLLCNPTDKNGGGISDPTAHLTCYKMKGPKLERSNRPKVEVVNQLGLIQLEVKKPFLLCVPSQKSVLP